MKYVFDAHTSNASKSLKVVLLYLWRTIVKNNLEDFLAYPPQISVYIKSRHNNITS
jgi:hypothetical protein